jgi:hypothetical protein
MKGKLLAVEKSEGVKLEEVKIGKEKRKPEKENGR